MKTNNIIFYLLIFILLNPLTITGVYGKFSGDTGYLGDKTLGIGLFQGGMIGGGVGGSPIYTIESVIEGSRTSDMQTTFVPVGKWFYHETKGNASVAFTEAGAVPFYCKCTFIDLMGLNDEYIAHHGFSMDYLLNRKPDYIILASQNKTNFVGVFSLYDRIYNNKSFKEKYKLTKIFGQSSKVKQSASWFLWIYKKSE